MNPGNVEWFANAIETGAIKLPELQAQHKKLQNQIQNMQCQERELERQLRVINNRITELADVEKMHQQNFDTLADNICNLQNQKHQLEQFVLRFKDSNKKYLHIKGVAEDHVNRLLREQESLLDLALNVVIEALRMNPDRYKIIYNSKYDNNNDNVFDSSTTPSAMPSSSIPQNYYYNKYHEGILEIAKGFLKILTNQIVDKTMVAAIKEKWIGIEYGIDQYILQFTELCIKYYKEKINYNANIQLNKNRC